MRLLIGMVFGALLTIGWAFWTDSAAGPNQRPMVNWDVAAAKFQSLMGGQSGY
jgi:hypothetical protein